MLKLFNTLSRKVEEVSPINPEEVTMYACGPTVYDYTHIGHLRKYIGDDLIRRVLEANGYPVKFVMNITDVGHLESDADEGEDKLEKGAKETGRTVWEVAKFYEEYFFKSTDQVNILRPNITARATEHIAEMIKLIQKLEEKGFTYQSEDAIYFDTSKFPNYTQLSGQKLEEKEVGAREDVVIDKQKKNPQDFVLWFFTVGKYQNHAMKWDSPWGEGFPGWHIECSAMSMLYLGDTVDIHTGGIDHIPVHHTNEIAQSEAATGEKFVNIWVHHEFLMVDSQKMSKSKKNFYTYEDIIEKGFEPLALRYLFLTAHYKDFINFTWESLGASQNALNNIRSEVRGWDQPGSFAEAQDDDFYRRFLDAANNDLNLPQALAITHELIKSNLDSSIKSATLLQMDKVLGLGLEDYIAKPKSVPQEVMELVEKRENVRKAGDYEMSDKLRKEIKDLGFEVLDTPQGPKVR